MPVSPDLLIVPSKLQTFARKLPQGTLALNPGQLIKGSAGGTYASMTIHPVPKAQLDQAASSGKQARQETLLPHQVAERTSLQIRRI